MTLQRKFAVLFLLLGLAAIVNIAVGAWTVGTLRRELTWPLESIQEVMRGLHGVKRAAEDQLDTLGYGRGPGQIDTDVEPTDERRAAFDRGVESMRTSAAFLRSGSSYEMRSGIISSRNLLSRIDRAIEHGHAWFEGDEGAREEARRALNEIHELIERIEGHVLEDARLAVDFGDRIQRLVLIVAGVALLILIGSTIASVRLVRAWVLQPVERLREAASRIGQGDFDHRIGFEGRDEMAQLAREVDEMAALVSSMQDEAVDRERLAAMGEMTRRIVHNLRNPLAGIRSLAELTRDDVEDPDLTDAQTRIISTVDRFEGWLRDLLNSSRPLELHPESVEVGPWMLGIIEAHRGMASSRRVSIEPRIEATTWSFDPQHMEQAVVAVLTNAIQMSPTGGRVRIEVEEVNRGLEFRIADEGPGVTPENRIRIFDPYFTTRQDGTGIGLALTRHVMNEHKGRATVRESIGQAPQGAGEATEASGGAEFVLWLPRRSGDTVARTGL